MKGFNSKWYLKRTGIQLAAPRRAKKRGPSKLEEKFEALWRSQFNSEISSPFPPKKEHRFHPDRRYRFDFAWPDAKVALEIDGAVWMKRGGHTSGSGKTRDCEKDFLAIQNGWRVIRWTDSMITRKNCNLLRDLLLHLTF